MDYGLGKKKGSEVTSLLIASLFVLFSTIAGAQGVTNIEVRKYQDTAHIDYPYMLPILGQKVIDKKIDLPLPMGISITYLQGVQAVKVSDVKVGLNNNPLQSLDFIQFGDVKAKVQTLNTRLDAYVLPFLNVYGIFGRTWTNIKVPVTYPIEFTSDVSSKGFTYGFGATVAVGVNNYFLALDGNITWTKVDIVDKSVRAMILAPRVGKVFNLKGNYRNIALWVGAFGISYDNTNTGSLSLSDAIPPLPDSVINSIISEKADWYKDLTKPQQKVVKEIAEKIRDKAQGLNTEDATVNYSISKRAVHAFNMLAGMQFQLTPHWIFRTEGTFFSQRSSLLISVNYRFGF